MGHAADVVVGNQIAQGVGGFAARALGLRKMQLIAGASVHYFGVFEFVDFVLVYPLPHIQRLHDFFGFVRERDFAAIVRRVGQHGGGAFFHHSNAQAAGGHGAGKTQTGGPGADNHHIAVQNIGVGVVWG